MNIEIKVDPELLAVLIDIKDELSKLSLSPTQVVNEEVTQAITLEEFTAPQYTLQEVRGKLATLESAKAKELISSFGVKKLTDLPKEKYAELMKKVGEV